MSTHEPTQLRDKIVSAATKYLAQSDQWATVAIIQKNTDDLMDTLCSILKIKRRVHKSDREPQSEVEESKQGPDFETEIAKEARKFILAIEKLSIVNEADLKDLRDLLGKQK